MKRDTDRKISIEDLIRLKRAERPAADFWANFEAEIRAKQLSAIINKRPWWDGISRIFAVARRHRLPFGAAAAVAFTWTGVQYAGSHSVGIRSPEVKHGAPVAVAAAPRRAVPVAELEAPLRKAVEVAENEAAADRRTVVRSTASHLSQAPSDIVGSAVSKSPFGDGISVSLAAYRGSALDYTRPTVFSSDREFEPSVAPARQPPSEPLARMDPSEERRERLLAPALPAYSSGSPRSLTGDWMRQRASTDERMYESMDTASSDRMLVGFRF